MKIFQFLKYHHKNTIRIISRLHIIYGVIFNSIAHAQVRARCVYIYIYIKLSDEQCKYTLFSLSLLLVVQFFYGNSLQRQNM